MPRWLHAWAILTVCAALPLLFLGAQVTTMGAGMVDQQSLRTPWHLFTVSFSLENFAYLVEHSHRFFGWLVGLCCIVQAVALWRSASYSSIRWLGWFALFVVSVQGVLGIVRVKFNALAGTEFAMVHGLFAQLAFATLVSVAVATSPAWQRGGKVSGTKFRGIALALGLVVYGQIAFGAVVRHLLSRSAQRFHILIAFAVAALVFWLFLHVRESARDDRGLVRIVWLLAGLVVLQIMLGVEAWLGRFGAGIPAMVAPVNSGQIWVRTGHYLVGALLFSGTVALNVWLRRPAEAKSMAVEAA
jgi:heme A synthase